MGWLIFPFITQPSVGFSFQAELFHSLVWSFEIAPEHTKTLYLYFGGVLFTYQYIVETVAEVLER